MTPLTLLPAGTREYLHNVQRTLSNVKGQFTIKTKNIHGQGHELSKKSPGIILPLTWQQVLRDQPAGEGDQQEEPPDRDSRCRNYRRDDALDHALSEEDLRR